LKYTKQGKVRWISHRDVARALERAFRITQLPLAFTEGFSPRPKVSFGLALSTGHESDGEYLDLVFTGPVELDTLPALLGEALPAGIDVTDAVALNDRAPALQEAVTAVGWKVEVADITAAELQRHVDAAITSPTLVIEKRRKGRDVAEDIRPIIRHLAVLQGVPATVVMELETQPRSAKPGDVLAAMSSMSTGVGLIEARALRTHQWIERDGARCEPLDADTRPTREGTDAGVRSPRELGARDRDVVDGRNVDGNGSRIGSGDRTGDEATPAGVAGRAGT